MDVFRFTPFGQRLTFALLLSLSSLAAACRAAAPIAIDARQVPPVPSALPFATGGSSPDGHTLGVNSRYFTRDGLPWFPVMGEFHYARYPEDEWETELLKMKAGGISIVATYVFWIFHEEEKSRFDWKGRRDLRKFVQMCAKHGLYVWLRIGPWDHGEVRNGGLPDWLVGGPTRNNAPAYLAAVQSLYHQIGDQVHGLLWKDGGPIIGVQIENEYHPAHDGEAHMTRLLELARAAGIEAPFYSATGWDHAVIPSSPFLPVFGGYTAQFWSNSRTKLPPNQNFFFTPVRAEDNVGYNLQPKDSTYHAKYLGYPFLTAEMGGGMAVAYHRRPVMHAADSTAAALVKLGSGIDLLGFYMYHGGTNPDGHASLEESLSAWNGFNDLEAKSYDFQAPLGEFGQERTSYRTLKALLLFLHDFGGRLAPMVSTFPGLMPRNLDDRTTPRVALRSDGVSGFLFINNYQRNYPLPVHRDFQVRVAFHAESVLVPERPLTLPTGIYTFWPLNLDLGTTRLRYATAEPLCLVHSPETYVFFAEPGVRPEFAFDAVPSAVSAPGARVTPLHGGVLVDHLTPGRGTAITLSRTDGTAARIILLSRADALDLYKTNSNGRDLLLLSPAALAIDGHSLRLSAANASDLRVALFPAPTVSPPGFTRVSTSGLFTTFSAGRENLPNPQPAVRLVRTAAPAPPVRINPKPSRHIPLAPLESAYQGAAEWCIQLPDSLTRDGGQALLRICYKGDVARLYAGSRLLDDNFYKGTPFVFGLWRLSPAERQAGLTLKILPLRRDTPIYLQHSAWPRFGSSREALSLDRVSIVPLYDAVFELPR